MTDINNGQSLRRRIRYSSSCISLVDLSSVSSDKSSWFGDNSNIEREISRGEDFNDLVNEMNNADDNSIAGRDLMHILADNLVGDNIQSRLPLINERTNQATNERIRQNQRNSIHFSSSLDNGYSSNRTGNNHRRYYCYFFNQYLFLFGLLFYFILLFQEKLLDLEGKNDQIEINNYFNGSLDDSTSENILSHELSNGLSSGITASPLLNLENITMQVKADALQLDIPLIISKAGTYSLLSAMIPLIQMSLLLFQIVHSGTQAQTANISLLSIGMMAVLDAYSTLIYFTSGILLESISGGFAIVAILKLILFAVIELRYLFLIFRSRYPQTLEANMRQQIGLLYTRFYFFLIGCIFISYQFRDYHRVLAFLASSFWVPQILLNIERNCRKPYHISFLIGMSATRLFEPLYYYGCPRSFIPLISEDKTSQFSPITASILFFWVAFQVLVIHLQKKYGARFFVPKFLLPKEYDYYRPISNPTQDELDCVICMEQIHFQNPKLSASEKNDPISAMEKGQPANFKQYVITPCNHVFHEECLQRWCVQKMECPTCRTTLPQNSRLLAPNNAEEDAATA